MKPQLYKIQFKNPHALVYQSVAKLTSLHYVAIVVFNPFHHLFAYISI